VPERLSELDVDELIYRARGRSDGRMLSQANAPVGDGRLWWGGEEDA